MSDTLVKIEVNPSTALRKFTVLPEAMRGRLRATIVRDTKELSRLVKTNLSGAVLKVRTGRLLLSVKTQMVENKQSVFGRVFSEGVPYARIHEYGGTTRAHKITAINAQALHFFIGSREFFRRSVNHPGSKIPERSYMRSALARMEAALIKNMTDAVRHPGNWPRN